MTRTRPILFTGPMVRAVLDRRKSQTLRLCEPQPVPYDDPDFPWCMWKANVRHLAPTAESFVHAYGVYLEDDLLWVRETTAEIAARRGGIRKYVAYRADGLVTLRDDEKWKPSIHMPRETCRLVLRVVRDSTILRLQDLTPADLNQQGMLDRKGSRGGAQWEVAEGVWRRHPNVREAFYDAWDRMYGRRATASDNPWVHKISFEVIKKGNKRAFHAPDRRVWTFDEDADRESVKSCV